MKTATLLGAALALTLLAPASAQDSKPTQTPKAAAQGDLARDVLADLILGAAKKGVLQHRLFTKRYYRADEKRGQTVIVTGQGKATPDGFQFELAFDVLSRGDKGKLVYEFDAQGGLQGVEISEERKGETRTTRVTIAGGQATLQRLRAGQPRGKDSSAPWTGDTISLFSALVLIPSLGDLASEKITKIKVINEDDRIGRSNDRARDIFVGREERKTPEGTIQVVTLEQAERSRPLAKITVGTGADQGVIREVLIDPKPDGRYDLRMVLISDKEAKRLQSIAPLLGNEGNACSALRSVLYAQTNFKGQQGALKGQEGGGKFASSLEDLAKAKTLYDKKLIEGTSPGYLILIRSSADGQAWMAVAVPDDPGKTGRFYFVTNTDGVVFRSKKPIELDETCKIPAGLEKVGR